jgi:hypothetical protein
MQGVSWKMISGSERTFREQLRTPDASFPRFLKTLSVFLPIGFGVLMIPFVVLALLAEALLGPQSWTTYWLHAMSTYVLRFGTYAMVLTFVAMYGLRGYIALKLRRQNSVQ